MASTDDQEFSDRQTSINRINQQQKPGSADKTAMLEGSTTTKEEQLCAATIETCKLACENAPPQINTCDPKTLSWNCQCPPGHTQTIHDTSFPIAYHIVFKRVLMIGSLNVNANILNAWRNV
jgi:hypothetical protein